MSRINTNRLHVLLADDDTDDCLFFEKTLNQLSLNSTLETVNNGESLMNYLLKNVDDLPDVLFLDLNMPRKNGFECLEEIKANEKLKRLVVIIFSTAYYYDDVNFLYQKGAHCYVRKPHWSELKEFLSRIFTLLAEMKFKHPDKQEFVFGAEGL